MGGSFFFARRVRGYGGRRYGDTERRRCAGGLLKESPEPPELSRTNYCCRNPALVPGSSLLLRSCMAAEIRRGTLERVPQTPPELSRTNYYCRNPAFVPGSSLFLRSCMAAEIRRGTLERVPRTPQNFPERIIAAVTQRSRPVLRASPLSNTTFPPTSSAAQVQPQGCRGRSPRQN